MFSVVKKLHFCYGHRLMDYDGKCAHVHGHNAVAEVEVARNQLDARGMVCDFGDVADLIWGFIERELDHRMLLRRDDPLVAPLEEAGERPFLMTGNPTAENIARLIFEQALQLGLPIVAVRIWETAEAFAEYRPGGRSD